MKSNSCFDCFLFFLLLLDYFIDKIMMTKVVGQVPVHSAYTFSKFRVMLYAKEVKIKCQAKYC